MGHGGKRAGAGKKKGTKWASTLSKEAAREVLRQHLTLEMKGVADALVSRCKGVRYFVTRNKKTGKYELVTDPEQVIKALNQEDEFTGEFYTDKPETAAMREFFDRTCDRAPQPMTVDATVTASEDLMAALLEGRKRAAAR